MAMLLGGMFTAFLLMWALYLFFASIFKHKVGFYINIILWLISAFVQLIFAKKSSMFIEIIISIIIFIPFILQNPKFQVRNYKKGENSKFHYYWYKEKIVRRNMKNFSFDFEFYENNKWVKDDNLNKQFSEDVRISKEKNHKNIYQISEEKAMKLIDDINKKPETKD